jgi:hypothetical protein
LNSNLFPNLFDILEALAPVGSVNLGFIVERSDLLLRFGVDTVLNAFQSGLQVTFLVEQVMSVRGGLVGAGLDIVLA